MIEIGPCGYAEPGAEESELCQRSGKRLTVRDPLGYLRSIIRCRAHSGWEEALEEHERNKESSC